MAVVIAQVNDSYTYGQPTPYIRRVALRGDPLGCSLVCAARAAKLREDAPLSLSLVARSRSHNKRPTSFQQIMHTSVCDLYHISVMHKTPAACWSFRHKEDGDSKGMEDLVTPAIARFNRQIRLAARYVTEKFTPQVDAEDAIAEAVLMILQYSGLTPGGPHHGCLPKVTEAAEGDEKRVRKIILTQLYLDLEQKFARQLTNEFPVDLNPEITYATDEAIDPTERIDMRTDFSREMPRLRREYPTLMANAVDEYTEEQIARRLKVDQSTVSRRLAKERTKAANDPFFWPLGKDGQPSRPVAATAQADYEVAA